METKKKIVMSGYYGFDNSGDDAILKAITTDIKKKRKDIEITVLSNNPRKTKEIYGVEAVNRFSIRQVNNVLKNSSLLISGGGSLLQDVTSTRSLFYYLTVMALAKRYNKPVMVYSNGIGPINKKINRKLTKKVLDKVDLITLRDEDSKRYVDQLGVTNSNIYVTADPVFTLQGVDEAQVKSIFTKESIPLNKKYVGVSIRKWKYDDRLIEILPLVINEIISRYDVQVILIPMHYPEDLEISKEVLRKTGNSSCSVLENEYSVEKIMGIINNLELIIAMRLHSLIYAATQETPMIGLSYDPKVDGILKSLEIENIVHVNNFTYEELLKEVDYVWNNKDKLKINLKKQDKALKDKALKNVNMALDLLGDDRK